MIYEMFIVLWLTVYLAFGFFCGYTAFRSNPLSRNAEFPKKFIYYHGIFFIILFTAVSVLTMAFAGAYALVK